MIRVQCGNTLRMLNYIDIDFNRKNVERTANRFGKIVDVQNRSGRAYVRYNDNIVLAFENVSTQYGEDKEKYDSRWRIEKECDDCKSLVNTFVYSEGKGKCAECRE